MNIKNNKILRIIFFIRIKIKNHVLSHTRNQSFIRSMSFLFYVDWVSGTHNTWTRALNSSSNWPETSEFRLVSCDKGTKLEKAKKKSRKARFHSKHKARAFFCAKLKGGMGTNNETTSLSLAQNAAHRGAGGKLMKQSSRKPPATPYARPQQQSRWLSKLVDPAYRLITGGATRILPSFFSNYKSPQHSLPAPTDQQLEDHHGLLKPLSSTFRLCLLFNVINLGFS